MKYYDFGSTNTQRIYLSAPNAYCPERIKEKVGPAWTFGYKPEDDNAWVNLSRHITFNYHDNRRGSNASQGTYDIPEEAPPVTNGINGKV